MPYCTKCGNQIDERAAYCSQCGMAQKISSSGQAAQPGATPGVHTSNILDGISNRTASILCYIPVFGVIPAIIFLAAHQFRHNTAVRFNAFQSVYLFVAWLIVSSAFPVFMLGFGDWGIERGMLEALKLLLVGCWIYLLVKAANLEQIRLPIIGDLAARSTTEQL